MLCGDTRTEICGWITSVKTEVDVVIAQVFLVNALVLDNLCEYSHESHITWPTFLSVP